MDITAPVTDYIKGSILTTKDDLLLMGDTAPVRLAKGVNYDILTCSLATGTVRWTSIIEALRGQFSQRGCLMTYFSNDVRRLSVGTINQVLSNDGYDLKWKNALETLLTLLTTQGDIIKRGVTYAERMALGDAKQFLRVNAGATDVEYATPYWIENALLAVQGDIVKRGAAAPEAMSLGDALQFLRVNAGANNLEYATPYWIEKALLTNQGDIIKRGAAVNERLAKGTANQVLSVNEAGDDLEYRSLAAVDPTQEGSNKNTVQVVCTPADTVITQINITDATVLERYMFTIYVSGTKGDTTGDVTINVRKQSGAGAISFGHDKTETIHKLQIWNGEDWAFTTSFNGRITTAGSLILELTGLSIMSDFTIEIGDGQMYALRLRR